MWAGLIINNKRSNGTQTFMKVFLNCDPQDSAAVIVMLSPSSLTVISIVQSFSNTVWAMLSVEKSSADELYVYTELATNSVRRKLVWCPLPRLLLGFAFLIIWQFEMKAPTPVVLGTDTERQTVVLSPSSWTAWSSVLPCSIGLWWRQIMAWSRVFSSYLDPVKLLFVICLLFLQSFAFGKKTVLKKLNSNINGAISLGHVVWKASAGELRIKRYFVVILPVF